MNKRYFRVIFSRTLQRFVVTSELAKAEGKSTEKVGARLSDLQIFAQIRPLVFSLLCAFGLVAFPASSVAETLIIRADKSAPKDQQPIILQTANGLPQINIQTPNAKGLSHNKYTKFDVGSQGAILNNSRTNVQTQQAGWVQANPYLATGEAKVILNEVNATDPSVLKGYVEVAGKQAEVIIANPAGIHCQGCGVINADRVTLTTGKPQIQHGDLERFVVEKGKVSVSGKGLDNSRVDYTDILAREVQANAGIWSKKQTRVVTGKNTIKRSDPAENLQIVHTNSPLVGESQPQFAVDVGQLGGMYAGKIHLIGTEHGVGVRNAGHIGVSAENLTIDSQGRIINSGTLNAAQNVHLSSQQGIENQGKIENRQGNIRLASQADIQQDGTVVVRGGNLNKTAAGVIRQRGESLAQGDIAYQAASVQTEQTALTAAGAVVKSGEKGEVLALEPLAEQGKSIRVASQGKATLQGKHLAAGTIELNAASADLNHSQNQAYHIAVTAEQGDIQADAAQFTAVKRLAFNTPETLSTQASELVAETIHTQQKNVVATNALWKQTGTALFQLQGDRLTTQGGSFIAAGDIAVKARELHHRAGRLESGRNLEINVAQQIDSTGGQLFAHQHLRLASQRLNNDNGLIYAAQKLTLANVEQLSNQHTNADHKGIVAGRELELQSGNLNNHQGRIISPDIHLTALDLNNNEGTVRAENQLTLQATQLTSHQGRLLAG